MKLLVALVALLCASCATITMNTTCPPNSSGVSFSLSGSTVGNQALTMLGFMAQSGKLMAATPTPEAPATSATMTYKYLPIFGSDAGALTCVTAPQQTVVVTSPPATVVR